MSKYFKVVETIQVTYVVKAHSCSNAVENISKNFSELEEAMRWQTMVPVEKISTVNVNASLINDLEEIPFNAFK
jgi:hypothetical protein